MCIRYPIENIDLFNTASDVQARLPTYNTVQTRARESESSGI